VSDSLAQSLTCIECGAAHSLTYRLECERCHGLLELRYDITRLQKDGPALLQGAGLWRYAPVLPIGDPAHRVTLGEGGTPLLDCPRLASELGVRRLLLKFDGPNPTGTVKDRSSATAVGAALQFGYRATSVVSSGNAGSSIAAYSARAGLRSLIFAYERASAPKLLHMAATTTDLVIYKGVYDDLISIWDRLVEEALRATPTNRKARKRSPTRSPSRRAGGRPTSSSLPSPSARRSLRPPAAFASCARPGGSRARR